MQTVEYPLPQLPEDDRVDLGMMLIGQSGVAGIEFQHDSIRVTYDPNFTDKEVLKSLIDSSGYATAQGIVGAQ